MKKGNFLIGLSVAFCWLITIFLSLPLDAEQKNSDQEITKYIVQATLDPKTRRATGEVTISWWNRTKSEVSKIPMVFKNPNKEDDLIHTCAFNGKSVEIQHTDEALGFILADDQVLTGFEILLPHPLLPNAKCTIHLNFTSSPVKDKYGFLHFTDRWFPAVLGVREGKFTPNTEELCSFEMRLEYPVEFKCAHSGSLVSEKIEKEKTRVNLKAKEISDFGVLLSKDFIIAEDQAEGIEIRSFYFKDDEKWGKRLLEMSKDIISFYAKTIGFYPQPVLSILPGMTRPAGGYPICPNCVVIHRGLDQASEDFANFIMAHEIGHQYWGFGYILEDTSYPRWFGLSMGIYTDQMYGEAKGLRSRTMEFRTRYLTGALSGLNTTIIQPMAKLEKEDFDWNNIIAHGKSFTVLKMLEYVVGTDTFREIFRSCLSQFKGKVVTLEKFEDLCEKISGKNLSCFFYQWYKTPAVVDYEITSTKSRKENDEFIVDCKLVRKGEAIMPLVVTLECVNGNVIRKTIDGWFDEITVVFKSNTGPLKVILDPDNNLPLISKALDTGFISWNTTGDLNRMKKYNETLRLLKNIHWYIIENPDYYPYYWEDLSIACLGLGDYQTAEEYSKKILDLKNSPQRISEDAVLRLGNICDLMGKREEAIKYYIQAVKSERTKKSAQEYLREPYSIK